MRKYTTKEMVLEPVRTQGMAVPGSKNLNVIHFSEWSEMFNADFAVIPYAVNIYAGSQYLDFLALLMVMN